MGTSGRLPGALEHPACSLGTQPSPLTPQPGAHSLCDPESIPSSEACDPGSEGPAGGNTFAVPKSSSLTWPPPNSFFTVARVAAYSIFSRT